MILEEFIRLVVETVPTGWEWEYSDEEGPYDPPGADTLYNVFSPDLDRPIQVHVKQGDKAAAIKYALALAEYVGTDTSGWVPFQMRVEEIKGIPDEDIFMDAQEELPLADELDEINAAIVMGESQDALDRFDDWFYRFAHEKPGLPERMAAKYEFMIAAYSGGEPLRKRFDWSAEDLGVTEKPTTEELDAVKEQLKLHVGSGSRR